MPRRLPSSSALLFDFLQCQITAYLVPLKRLSVLSQFIETGNVFW